MHEYHTFSCIGDMAIGAWGAYLASRDKYRLRMEAWKRPFISFFYALFIVIFFFRHQLLYSSHYVRIFERAFIAAIILVIILEQNYSKHSFFKLSKLGLATKLGVISYGLYCLHFIGILITLTITRRLGINNNLWIVLLVETCVALLITIFISKLSFRYFEQSFLRWKNRVSVTRNLVDTGSDSGEIHP
jgi:peptidoglycan/LPS O-acetylase OafA/YrhL